MSSGRVTRSRDASDELYQLHVLGTRAALLFTTPAAGSTNAERFLALSVAGARERLYVTNSLLTTWDDERPERSDAAVVLDDGVVAWTGDARDAPDADWEKNPSAYVIEKWIVDNASILKLKLAPGGGAAEGRCDRSRLRSLVQR